jgi:hypothetical protein
MVVVGIDAHKATHTLVAVDAVGRKLGELTVRATTAFSAAAAATSHSPAASLGAQDDRDHGIASAQAICPSKPSVLAMSR